MDTATSFGQWLRQRRKALGLTHATLAERVHCSVSALRKIEQDERHPSHHLAERLAACLQIPAAERPSFVEIARGKRRVQRLMEVSPVALPPLGAISELLERQMREGPGDQAILTGQQLVAVDPYHEPAHRTLMRAYLRQGRRGAALRQYQLCVAVLQRELGVEPEAETRQLYQEILRYRSGPARPQSAFPSPPEGRSPAPALVGRLEELARVREAFDQACGGSGRTVVLLGEAGVGKTRMLEEQAAIALQRDCHVVVGRCYETDKILPFGPWVEALRAALGTLEHGVLERLDPVWRAELGRLLPEIVQPELKPAGPIDDHLRLFAAIAELLRVLGQEQPLLLILEDLHWADEMSVRVFGYLARRVHGWPVLMLASAREEDLGEAPLLRALLKEIANSPQALSLSLSPLSQSETLRLVHQLMQAGPTQTALDRVAERVWDLSEGNPFVAVESMRAIQAGEQLEASTIALPDRVREVIARRIDRLGARACELLAVAAAIGREFEFALLQHAAGLGENEATEGLEECVLRGVIQGVGESFDFVHDRIRRVVYGQLLAPRRKLIHASIGQALETVYAHDLASHHAALGMHYRRGQVWDKAVKYLRHAGAQAVWWGANREGIAHFEQAVEVLGRLPAGRGKLVQAFDLRMHLCLAHWVTGELARVHDYLAEAETLADDLDDAHRRARVWSILAACQAVMGDQAGSVDAARRTLAAAKEFQDLPLKLSANFYLGLSAIALGEFSQAAALLEKNAAELQGELRWQRLDPVGLPSVFALAWLTVPLGELGAFAKAVAHGEEAVRIGEGANQPYSLALACWGLGNLYCLKHESAHAIPLLERSLALCRDYNLGILSPLPPGSLGYAYTLAGRIAEALPLLEEAVERGLSLNAMWGQSRRLIQLGEGYLLADRVHESMAAAERALALADKHTEPVNRAYALRLFGELALNGDHPDLRAAEQYLSQAFALAERFGMQPLAARCRLGLAQFYVQMENQAAALQHLRAAVARFREMDMGSALQQAEMQLNRL